MRGKEWIGELIFNPPFPFQIGMPFLNFPIWVKWRKIKEKTNFLICQLIKQDKKCAPKLGLV